MTLAASLVNIGFNDKHAELISAAIANAVVGYIKADGSVPFTADQPMGSHKITGLASASADGDAVSWGNFAWRTWTPSFTGFSTNPTGGTYQYILIGGLAIIQVWGMTPGNSNSSAFTIGNLPFTTSGGNKVWAPIRRTDNGGGATEGMALLSYSSSTIELYTSWSGAGWTSSSTKSAEFTLMARV